MNENSKLPAQKTVSNWLVKAQDFLASHSLPTPRLDTEVLLAHALGQTRTWLVSHADYVMSSEELENVNRLLVKRAERIPVAYLTGHKEFYGRDFIVTPDTLIPRPETETLIDLVLSAPGLSWSKETRVLDVGTGSGCIGLTLKAERNDMILSLSDISPHALAVARANAEGLGLEDVLFIQSNLLENWIENKPTEAFSVIVANLPYVDETWERSLETNHEPSLALFADNGGLALINKLIAQAPHLLEDKGLLALEADPEQHLAIADIAEQNGFQLFESREYALVFKLI